MNDMTLEKLNNTLKEIDKSLWNIHVSLESLNKTMKRIEENIEAGEVKIHYNVETMYT